MNETEYLNTLTKKIAGSIAQDNPILSLEGQDVYAVISAFLSEAVPEIGQDLIDSRIDWYVGAVLQNARALDPSFLQKNPYIKRVRFNTIKSGKYLLTNQSYEKGEILQYAFPLMEDGVYIPRLAYFTKKTNFPTIYEKNVPWMSVIPSEITSMEQPIAHARGNMLVLGLGLGYYAYRIGQKKEVSKITIVEKSSDVIALFEDNILCQFEKEIQDKITLVCMDAHAYMKQVQDNTYDGIFADLWEGAADGHAWYEELHAYEAELSHTRFDYWIEEYLHDKMQ